MIELLAHLVVNAALLLIVARLVTGLCVEGWGSAFIGALVLGLVNFFVRPVMVILTLPLTVLTLGLFLLIVNACMLWLVSVLVPGIRLRSFGAAVLASLLLSLLNLAVSALVAPGGHAVQLRMWGI
jgi:putative membrane protein